MKLKKVLASILASAMVLGSMGTAVLADNATVTLPEVDVSVDATTTWSAAMNSATDENGDGIITYGISGKVIVDDPQIKGAAENIYIIGIGNDAELSVECERGNITIKDSKIRTVNFANLTLSRLNGSWIGDLDNTNKFFTVWTYQSSATQVNYTNCVFPQGTAAAYPGKTVYTECNFCNTTDSNFGLWVYAVGETIVTDSVFKGNAGLKTYGYASQTNMKTVIEDTTFEVTKKPAVVASGLGTIALNNVNTDDCEYGVWETAVVGGNMATVTQDGEEPVYNAICTDKYGSTVYTSSTDYAETVVKEAVANGKDSVVTLHVAQVEGVKYFDLAEAIDAAPANGTVTILGDVTVDSTIVIDKNITFEGNGYTIKGKDVTETETNGTAVTPITINDAEVIFNNITVKGGNAYNDDPYQPTASHGVAGAGLNVTNGKLIIDNSTIAGGDAGAEYTKSTGSAIVAVNSDVVATNSTLATGRATRSNVIGVATVYLDADSTIDLTDVVLDTARSTYASDNVIASFHENGEDTIEYTGDVNLDGEITVLGTRLANVNVVAGNNLTLKGNIDASYIADTLEIVFVKKDLDEQNNDTDEQADLYDIVVKGNKQFINRLTTADLTFKLESEAANENGAAPVYEIIPVDPVEVTTDADYKNRYMFNFNGITQPDETAAEIVIGQVQFTGYGKYKFFVNADFNETNVVHATKTNDSIVKEFFVGGNTANGEGNLVINNEQEGGVVESEIKVPTRTLTVNVSFPNAVVDNKKAYQDMKVTITGNIEGENKTVTYNFGTDEVAMADNGSYQVVEDKLVLNNKYTVTVEGAGYRTASYTVTMNDAKTLNFWNNVKDVAEVVEEKKTTGAVKTTFLAGDIVKDANINIYDLSAVVAYFGTDTNTDAKDTLSKYDLNRDGKIDSKDVAYVLVSWNN